MEAGDQFMRVAFEDFEGNPIDIKEPERPLLINFWASWCGPCRYEFPALLDYARNELDNADLVLVNVSDGIGSAEAFLQTVDIEGIPSYIDVDDQFIEVLGLRAYPTSILLDRDGTLLIAHTGTVGRTFLDFADAVAAHPHVGELGDFEVTAADLIARVETPTADNSTLIEIDQEVEGLLVNEDWQHNFAFEGKADQSVRITLEHIDTGAYEFSDLDPYLVLFGPDGERITENDDGLGNLNSLITFTLPENGTYYIVATRWLEADSLFEGEYRLTLSAD